MLISLMPLFIHTQKIIHVIIKNTFYSCKTYVYSIMLRMYNIEENRKI